MQAPAERPKARSPARLTAGSVVPVLLAVLAAAFTYEALQDRSSMTSIVVAKSLVPAGAPVNSNDTRAVRVHSSDTALTQGLLSPAQLGDGWVAAVAVGAGQPVTLSEVEKPSLVPTLGQMSIAVPVVQAAGGRIAAGDLVDVIATNGSRGCLLRRSGPSSPGRGAAFHYERCTRRRQRQLFRRRRRGQTNRLAHCRRFGAQGGGVAGNGIEIIRSTGEPATSRMQYGMPAAEPLKVAGPGPASRRGS